MGKICLIINCRHYRPKTTNASSSDKNQAPGARPGTSDASSSDKNQAPGARPGTSDASSSSAANRTSRGSTKCSVLSIPSMNTDNDQ